MIVDIVRFRKQLADCLNRAAYDGERLRITRHGRVVVALVPPADIARLEEIEAAANASYFRADVAAAKRKAKRRAR